MSDPFGGNRALHCLFEIQAARTPDAAAVAFEGKRLTYAELDRRAGQLARHLRSLGVGPDVPVALFLDRSVELVVAILGVLKAGGAYLPIDAAAPAQRISYLLSDARVPVLLTQSQLRPRLPQIGTLTVIDVDFPDRIALSGPIVNQHAFKPSHLAYIMYTSGSTGQPKGVCVEHRNIVNYVLGVSERLRFEPGMHHALVSTISADLGNTVLFPALVTGGCLHVMAKERTEDAARLADYFEREKIDVLKIVPSHLAALQTGRDPQRVMPRRRLILGGEASRLDWVAQLRALAPACEIFNHYGPTETTVGVLAFHVSGPPPETASKTLCLGKPLPNSRVYVLDETGRRTAPGAQGEICIGGAGVARGYLHRPELTAQKFVNDPFAPGERMYRTGDVGRLLPDGNIEFCGRVDHQVKVHGYRVELGEIEGAVRESDAVREAVVAALDDPSGGKQLVAFLVPKRGGGELLTAAIRRHLSERLPQYMIPVRFVLLEKMPLNANGKVDRQALAASAAEHDTSAPRANVVKAQTPTQRELTEIWAALLGLTAERVGIHDDFFELGGHSLLAIRVLSRIRDACGVDLRAHILFESPTIAALAKAIDQTRDTSTIAGIRPIARQARRL